MTPFVRTTLRQLAIPLAIFVMLALDAANTVGYFFTEYLGNDFIVYWRTANGPFSAAYHFPGTYVFPYAPTMLLWIRPLDWLPLWPAFAAFNAISIATFCWAVRPYLTRLAILLCLISPPIYASLTTGQVTLLLAALIIIACRLENRWVAGVMFGAIATIKPHFLLMAPVYFLVTRDWRAFIAAGATFLAICLATLALLGAQLWIEWLDQLGKFKHSVMSTKIIYAGVTPMMSAERLGLPGHLLFLPLLVASLLLLKFGRKDGPIEQAALIGTASLLIAPYALTYDLAIMMPFMAVAIARGNFWAMLAVIPVHPIPIAAITARLLPYRPWPFARRATPTGDLRGVSPGT